MSGRIMILSLFPSILWSPCSLHLPHNTRIRNVRLRRLPCIKSRAPPNASRSICPNGKGVQKAANTGQEVYTDLSSAPSLRLRPPK